MEVDQLGSPQAVPVGDEDHGRVPVAPPVALGRFHEPVDLGLGEVLPAPQLGVGTPPGHDCSVYDGWRDQLEAWFGHPHVSPSPNGQLFV